MTSPDFQDLAGLRVVQTVIFCLRSLLLAYATESKIESRRLYGHTKQLEFSNRY